MPGGGHSPSWRTLRSGASRTTRTERAGSFSKPSPPTSVKTPFTAGNGTWRHILTEEVWEAFAEKDSARLRAELVQVAAAAVNWIEAIDRRQAKAP